MDYEAKYIKYKKKYLKLKNRLYGGGPGFSILARASFFENRYISITNNDKDTIFKEFKDEHRIRSCTLEEYKKKMDILKYIFIKLNNNNNNNSFNFNWIDLTKNVQILHNRQNLWILRDYILSLTFITAYTIIKEAKGTNIHIGNFTRLPPEFSNNQFIDCTIMIFGSSLLTSDIDVSINSSAASLWISVMEDLWETIGFKNSEWQIDLYSDGAMIGKFYFDTNIFTNDTKLKLLEYAIASYYKHTNASKFKNKDNEILDFIIKSYNKTITKEELIKIKKDNQKNIDDVNLLYKEDYNEYRNKYYTLLKQCEKIYNKLLKDITTLDESLSSKIVRASSLPPKIDRASSLPPKIDRASFLSPKIDRVSSLPLNRSLIKKSIENNMNELILLLSEANLYRQENYVLPTTVIHIVKILQGPKNSYFKRNCKDYIKIDPSCALTEKSIYLLSAIEQLGYMESKLHKENYIPENCNLGGTKYFVRLIDSIEKGGILRMNKKSLRIVKNMKDMNTKLNKKRQTGVTDINIICRDGNIVNKNINLYEKLKNYLGIKPPITRTSTPTRTSPRTPTRTSPRTQASSQIPTPK
jgi:hypothetical protein